MLELKHIRKVYHVGDIDTVALNDISVAFREKEFVAILGTSGSGKTTCLNIIGGLDRYDSGGIFYCIPYESADRRRVLLCTGYRDSINKLEERL